VCHFGIKKRQEKTFFFSIARSEFAILSVSEEKLTENLWNKSKTRGVCRQKVSCETPRVGISEKKMSTLQICHAYSWKIRMREIVNMNLVEQQRKERL
jgi:hypothetical protein